MEAIVERIHFRKPIFIWLDSRRPDFGTRRIATVQDGLAALHRYGLADFRLDRAGETRAEWAEAAAALVLAKHEPSARNVQAARDALHRLVAAAGSLASEPRLGSFWPGMPAWGRFA